MRNAGLSNINMVPSNAMLNDPNGNADAYRPFLLYGDINVIDHTLYSNYHSWQNLLSRQTGKLSFTAAYTFSKALGIRGGSRAQRSSRPIRASSASISYGVLGNDRRHILSVAYSWLLPEVKTGITNAILGNWQFSGISQFLSGVAAAGGRRCGQFPHRRHQRAGYRPSAARQSPDRRASR